MLQKSLPVFSSQFRNEMHDNRLAYKLLFYALSQKKNVPPFACYNLHIRDPIAIIFGISVSEKLSNQTMLCFPISPFWCFSITLQNKKPRRELAFALCVCVQHSPTVLLQRSRLPFVWTIPKAPCSWTHWLQDLGSYTAARLWVVSQKDWRNQAATGWILAMH